MLYLFYFLNLLFEFLSLLKMEISNQFNSLESGKDVERTISDRYLIIIPKKSVTKGFLVILVLVFFYFTF